MGQLETMIGGMYVYDTFGNPKKVDISKQNYAKRRLAFLFMRILQRLEDAGILTFKGDDPRKALGDFRNS
jgi:hypothetical protein